MAGNWYRSSPVFISIISVFQSFFSKPETQQLSDIQDQKVLDLGEVPDSSPGFPPPPPPPPPPPCQPPTPYISDSSGDLSPTPSSASPLSSYHTFFMDTKHPSLTKFAQKQHSHHQEASSVTVTSLCTVGHGRSASSPAAQLSAQSNKSEKMNPIVKLYRDQELGKTLLTYVIPIFTAILTVDYAKHASLPSPSIVVSLCIGLPAVWIGILFRAIIPDTISNAIEQFGACLIFFAFFSVVSSLLQPDLVWVPWTCFVATLVPSILSCLPGHWIQLVEKPDAT